jgi:hypothetical protein
MRLAITTLVLLCATTVAGATPSVLRAGANHHLGDDSFVARFGRAPTPADPEPLRMRVHLQYVRELLGSRPATRPALAERRATLLGYLDDYIAKGTTPLNSYVPYRNPVFIDRDGTICAVGYLIERSEGRALAETVAGTHRLDYLEDIAASMPEVASWVAASGLTLDELASIQPGYPGPDVMHLSGWLAKADTGDDWQPPLGTELPPDGHYHVVKRGVTTDGAFAGTQMVGAWKRTREGAVLGTGTFKRGSGVWTSFRANGTKLAEGPFARSHPDGKWRFYHPSGRVAAIGRMRAGSRDGTWTFFYDTETHGTLSVGRFRRGETLGTWRHFDEDGALVATSGGRAWASLSLTVEPASDGVRREIHQGIPAEGYRLVGFYKGNDRLYVDEAGAMFDGRSKRIEKTDAGWFEHSCDWKQSTRAAAKAGDATRLHAKLMAGQDSDCRSVAKPLGGKRARRYEALLASPSIAHGEIPVFDIDPAPAKPAAATAAEPDDADDDGDDAGVDAGANDMAFYLASTMTWYIEWPHVDGTFMAVYDTLPGYALDRGGDDDE